MLIESKYIQTIYEKLSNYVCEHVMSYFIPSYRLEEMNYVGGGPHLAAMREDLEQTHRREKTMQHELDQARQAIANMKVETGIFF